MLKTASQGRNLPSFLVLLFDVVGLVALGSVMFWLYRSQSISVSQLIMLLLVIVVPAALYILDAYGVQERGRDRAMVMRTLIAVGLAAVLICFVLMATASVKHDPSISIGKFPFNAVKSLAAGLGIFALWAVLVRWWFGRRVRDLEERRRWLVLGFDDSTRRFFDEYKAASTKGSVVLHPADASTLESGEHSTLPAHLSDDHLLDLLDRKWTAIVISDGLPPTKLLQDTLVHQRLSGTRVLNLVSFFEKYWLKLPVWSLRDQFFFESEGFVLVHNRLASLFKRVTDVVGSIVLLIIFAPLVPLIAMAIRVDSAGPILYRQIRSGEGGTPFEIRKFRTMRIDAEKDGEQWATVNDPRVTRVGRFLRDTRLDEIPQLWNVLIGEMSLIGPRPERPRFIKRLRKEIPFYEIRGVVKPGLTGWAQVMAPYGASVAESADKLAYDLYYIKNYSILLDVVILMKTIRVVLGGRGR